MHANPTYMQMSSNVGIVIKTVRVSAYVCVCMRAHMRVYFAYISVDFCVLCMHAQTNMHITHMLAHTRSQTRTFGKLPGIT